MIILTETSATRNYDR